VRVYERVYESVSGTVISIINGKKDLFKDMLKGGLASSMVTCVYDTFYGIGVHQLTFRTQFK